MRDEDPKTVFKIRVSDKKVESFVRNNGGVPGLVFAGGCVVFVVLILWYLFETS